MIKQTIKYHNHDDEEVTEDFYFHLDKLDILEMEIEHDGGLQEYIKKLTETSDASKAYYLFKDVILDSYGKRGEDKKFRKKDPVTRVPYKYDFEDSPALGEMIFGFIEDANKAATFVNNLLPPHEIRAAEERAKKEKLKRDAGEDASVTELPTAAPVMVDEEPTDEELLKMKPQDMSTEQLRRAFELKTKA